MIGRHDIALAQRPVLLVGRNMGGFDALGAIGALLYHAARTQNRAPGAFSKTIWGEEDSKRLALALRDSSDDQWVSTSSSNASTREEARRDIFAYIEGFYNRTRRHSAIGYLSPIEMELKAA